MDILVELRESQARILDTARSYLNEAATVDEARAKELEVQHDKAMADFDAIGEKITRAEKLDNATRALEAVATNRRPSNEGRAAAIGEEKSITYDDVVLKALRWGSHNLDREERAVLEARAQTSTTGSSGGYVVPVTLASEIEKAMLATGPMLDGTFIRLLNTTSGEQLNWPTVDDTAIVAELKAQNSAATDDAGNDVVFGTKRLDAYMYDTEIVRVPVELLEDSAFDIVSLMGELFGERLGRTLNTALTTGTGSSQPNGVVTASAAGKTAASATAITANELIDLQHSVDPAYRGNAAWMFNDATFAYIRKLVDGQSNYLWQMGDVRAGAPSTLLGQPYKINQAMDSIAAAKKVALFGDFKKYVVRKVGGYRSLRLDERYAEYGQSGFITFARVDGECVNTAAIKHLITAAA